MIEMDSEAPEGGPLRRQAAEWFACMRGPNAEAHRAEFEAWLARDGQHRGAYNRISEVFSMGKGLKPLEPSARPEAPAIRPSRVHRQIGLVVGVYALVSSLTWLAMDRTGLLVEGPQYASVAPKPSDQGALPSHLATRIGEIRQFRLSDGSTVILDTDSRLTVFYGPEVRQLRLERGRARFTVSHEERPFIVAAGKGTVTAHGTVFDVRLTNAIVVVRLLRGAIDVEMPATSRPGETQRIVKPVKAGEELAFAAAEVPAPSRSEVAKDENWPAAVRDLDHVRLADLVAEANRYSRIRTVLASPMIGELRVSGTFRINDTRKLAENLAALLDLSIDASRPGEIRLDRDCVDDVQKNCRPFS